MVGSVPRIVAHGAPHRCCFGFRQPHWQQRCATF